MNKLYIVGSGGLAREVLGWLKSENSHHLNNLEGFLVTTAEKPSNNLLLSYPIRTLTEVKLLGGDFDFILAIGAPKIKHQVINQVIDAGGKPVSYISESAHIGLNVTIGKGTIVNPRCSISSDVKIGAYSLINCNTGVGHDCEIGDYVSILGGANINGNVDISDFAEIGSGVTIHPGKKIGKNAKVGVGSIVLRNVKENTTVFGNPAKRI